MQTEACQQGSIVPHQLEVCTIWRGKKDMFLLPERQPEHDTLAAALQQHVVQE